MRTMHMVRAVLMTAVVPLTAHGAQQPGHQMPGMGQQPASQAAVAECAQAQPQVMRTIEAATTRVEAARQSNSPSAMRTAMDDLQGALGSLRAQLAACAALQAAAPADPHAGHTMPGMQQQPKPAPGTPMMQPGSTAPAPAAPMDHSKMPMAGAQSGKPGAAPGAKPATPRAADPHAGHAMPKSQEKPAAKPGGSTGAKPASPDAQMDHSKMQMGGGAKEGKVMDPVNGLMVDPATAPKTTYQGQTYYFSSEESRKEFLANPAKFAKKPKP